MGQKVGLQLIWTGYFASKTCRKRSAMDGEPPATVGLLEREQRIAYLKGQVLPRG